MKRPSPNTPERWAWCAVYVPLCLSVAYLAFAAAGFWEFSDTILPIAVAIGIGVAIFVAARIVIAKRDSNPTVTIKRETSHP